jgi:hypothetical protein
LRARQLLEADDIGVGGSDGADDRRNILVGRQDVEGHCCEAALAGNRASGRLGEKQRPEQCAEGDRRKAQAQQQTPDAPPQAGGQQRGQRQEQVLGDGVDQGQPPE